MPVPAPATANILQGVPIYGGKINGELCTPTGAALLKYYVTEFGYMPVMQVEKTGYGIGKKDFEAVNCVRAFLGETKSAASEVTELCCNVDDMTAEEIGYATQVFFKAGALDVYTIPIGMKKSRPGNLICVMCKSEEKEKFVNLIFKHTTTIGIRENVCRRYVLSRRTETVETKFGSVRKKISEDYGTAKEKFEFDDLAQIAEKYNMSISEVLKQIDKE